jgi:hypothetical protein
MAEIMSSAHIIIVARNDKTGAVELPLGDLTLYGVGGEADVLQTACKRYGPEWTLSLYRPVGASYAGQGTTRTEQAAADDQRDALRYRWLRDGNAKTPAEMNCTGGDVLDGICDAGVASGGPIIALAPGRP